MKILISIITIIMTGGLGILAVALWNHYHYQKNSI